MTESNLSNVRGTVTSCVFFPQKLQLSVKKEVFLPEYL